MIETGAGDNERELANLRHRHAGLYGGTGGTAGKHRTDGDADNLSDQNDRNQRDQIGPMIEDALRLEHHADRDEEDRTEHVAQRSDQMFYFVRLARLGNENAGKKRSEGDGVT